MAQRLPYTYEGSVFYPTYSAPNYTKYSWGTGLKSVQYSVMQSCGNSYCGYVVLDSFNMVNTDEDIV